ncbi:cytochrome P450 [Streptomyces sp. BK205]|uniref:cytochrome P450 n=1 Tax=Streptomyces sp. BK205 TaxID=2512164 RepID=UPI0010E2439E|nr:cytochrome P450 [Streptomyces sp. BK205]TCR16059.1 cytochrome P450 [Streptomyces sp. BK205]
MTDNGLDAIPGPRGPAMWRVLMGLQRDPVGTYLRCHQKYGDVIRFREPGGGSWVFVAHPDAVARIHQANHRNYGRGRLNVPFTRLLGDGLLTSERESWTKHRRVLAPAFRAEHQQHFASTVHAETRTMLDGWTPHADGGHPVDVFHDLERLTYRVVLRGMFDLPPSDEDETVLRHLSEGLAYVSKQSFRMYPVPSWLQAPARARFESHVAALDHAVERALAVEPIGARREGSILGALTASDLPAGAVRDELLTMLHAGQHTVASGIAFALHLIAAHPEVEQQVRTELSVLEGRPPELGDLTALPYLRRVLSESMRLYPPAWGGVRESLGEDELGGYTVPGGTAVVFSQYVTHRHPEFWPEPDRFEPDRFTADNAAGRPRYAYFPFGGGPHLCIGQDPAQIELAIVVGMILQRYRMVLTPGAKVVPKALLDLIPTGLSMLVERA